VAEPTASIEALTQQYGPHLNYAPAGGWRAESTHPYSLVKTHCCFCGQQCGIQLKVREDQVVGFEPWEEFPFNRGMLCPKGVKRYLQNNHPDRLLDPLLRSEQGFRTPRT
jgi:assimilatory nitrate reductase catalytic subunit